MVHRQKRLHATETPDIPRECEKRLLAPWRSGDAADCKSVYPGSIPGGASKGCLVYSMCTGHVYYNDFKSLNTSGIQDMHLLVFAAARGLKRIE